MEFFEFLPPKAKCADLESLDLFIDPLNDPDCLHCVIEVTCIEMRSRVNKGDAAL